METLTALVSDETAERNFSCLIDDLAVEDTRILFAAIALDLGSGEDGGVGPPEVVELVANNSGKSLYGYG